MRKFIILFVILTLINCSFNNVRENREEDKKDAEKITLKFYSLIKENKRQEVFKLFGSNFFEVSNKNELDKTIDWANKVAGNISDYSLSEWETSVVEGTDPKADYLLVYNVKRSKIMTQEIFFLKKENEKIKITGYKINLDISKNK